MVTLLLLLAQNLVLTHTAFLGALPTHYDYRGGVPGIGRDVSAGTESVMSNVGVGADYAYFASQLGQNPMELYGLYTAPLSGQRNTGVGNLQQGNPYNQQGSQVGHIQDQQGNTLSQNGNMQGLAQPQQDLSQFTMPSTTTVQPVRQNAELSAILNAGLTSMQSQQQGGYIALHHAPVLDTTTFPAQAGGIVGGQSQYQQQPLPTPPPTPQPPPEPEQHAMTNLFIAGIDKGLDFKQFFHPDSGSPDKQRGGQPIPGLMGIENTATETVAAAPPQRRAFCDPLVDAVFALDDISSLWMARDAIRNYVTRLRPQGKARFGVVLCGEHHSFYTSLHQHFSGLLASLEDLQHANVTLDITQHMPDTPGPRSDNNPYPPSVSEDFTQTSAGCLETAYFMFTYQSKDHVERQLTIIATKERWGEGPVLDEARYLQSLNISLLLLADGRLSARALDSLRDMASSPDRFRIISDSVTLHALPAIIGDAICKPQKADVTVPIQRTSTTELQNIRVVDCYQVNSTALERKLDFGHHFGLQIEVIVCPPGVNPDPVRCACVGI